MNNNKARSPFHLSLIKNPESHFLFQTNKINQNFYF